MEYLKENSIAFNSKNENFILSNLYPCTINYNGNLFCGVDHLYFYLLYFKHPDIQKKIKNCNGVCGNFNAKKIGDSHSELIKDIKDHQKVNLIKKVIRLKYQQNQHCKDYLLNTGNKELVEFAYWGDSFWGCTLKDNKFIGENNTGKILMEIREELRK